MNEPSMNKKESGQSGSGGKELPQVDKKKEDVLVLNK